MYTSVRPSPASAAPEPACERRFDLRDADADSLLGVYRNSADPRYAADLFREASRVRDLYAGTQPWWSSGVTAVTPCRLEPLCTYCNFFTTKETRTEDIVAAVRAVAALGIQHVHLSGGTRLYVDGDPDSGFDREVIAAVCAVRDAVPIQVEVNVGPSLSREGVRALRELGVVSITSSLEVLNKELFERLKPGDSLPGRIRLMEFCEEEGMPIRSMMLVGIGESDRDRMEHLLFLRRFSQMKQLRLSRYMPIKNSAAGAERCSPWPVARLTAMARLMYPSLEVGLAAGNSPDDIALWWLAGGGTQVLGASASMKRLRPRDTEGDSDSVAVHNSMPVLSRYFADLGLTPQFEPR